MSGSTLVRGLDSRVGRSKVVDIDLATGKPKAHNPLKDANDYSKWDSINGQIDQDGELVDFSWQELPYDEIRVRIPVSKHTKSKQCKVVVKRNWLYVWAPAPDYDKDEVPEDRPPKKPLLDFQLYGAVDAEESDVWELVDDGAVRNLILILKKSPIYKWPTLNRVNGLKCEADRERVRKQEMEEARKKFAQPPENKEQYEGLYPQPAGPSKPPVIGPMPDPAAERQKNRTEATHKAEVARSLGKIPSSSPTLTEAEAKRPPGVYEGGRIIVCKAESDSSDSE
ncbi:hypothetical protein AB1Y20_014203 [Prymnesium parvum]|uniref:CS domain-containing protein n=1 Tax=Prymnesium parvum TaxID=97485 RepID=A0AB34IFK1_PRYPA|mmetsp:Transcript_45387/g.112856  ORF Transcript_45387/g.112856 Transcript_45387/m.112856 type:complete len:282 (-) Transcript_45387:270-1115(-)|eukprot:CAMPEP_0195618968 /NCGR_PEP_ID=MMETSP0815-20121206/14360_1 /TAXON_ID=97485 /ORGANISM="Prymnesium parvum, Strain Texoma1" /LENGTH=281 /DNA_ID=CAMNT_0040759529 /DNA_START=43 /DNA_END=888 /DNA_ORIENTATION=+